MRLLFGKVFIVFSLVLFAVFPLLQSHDYGRHNIVYEKQEADSVNILNLVFAGDVMEHMPQVESAYDTAGKTYDFNSCFKYVKEIISKGDLAGVNLETTLSGVPYTGYPQFSSPEQLGNALKNAGFNIIFNANNHCCDKGKRGIERTITKLDSIKIKHTGTFNDSTERMKNYPLIFEKNNIRIALLNCTYGTNGIIAAKPVIVNYIDTTQIKDDIAKAKTNKVDFIIMFIHWGNEYEREPNQSQINTANFLIRNGVNLIIGSHPHVLQKFSEVITKTGNLSKQGLVFYSMGNFISNQKDRYCDGGMIAEVVLSKNIKTNRTRIKNYGFIPTWVYKEHVNNRRKYYILPCNEFVNDTTIFKIPNAERNNLKLFYKDTKMHLDSNFEIRN